MCKRTGEKVMLAKYYPSIGWCTYDNDLVKSLNDLFERDNSSLVNIASENGVKDAGSMWDGNAHEIVYEVVDDE